jgi:hypothetical protein
MADEYGGTERESTPEWPPYCGCAKEPAPAVGGSVVVVVATWLDAVAVGVAACGSVGMAADGAADAEDAREDAGEMRRALSDAEAESDERRPAEARVSARRCSQGFGGRSGVLAMQRNSQREREREREREKRLALAGGGFRRRWARERTSSETTKRPTLFLVSRENTDISISA